MARKIVLIVYVIAFFLLIAGIASFPSTSYGTLGIGGLVTIFFD